MNNESSDKIDAELLAQIARGDRLAFETLYDRQSSVLYALILRIVANPIDAQDILQEVFIQIWDKASTYDPLLGKPFSWTVALTRNKALDRIRSVRRREDLLKRSFELANEKTMASVDDLPGRELAGIVRQALRNLSDEQRKAIELAFFSGLSQNEIAGTLRIPLGTVKARIRRGMLKLREELNPYL